VDNDVLHCSFLTKWWGEPFPGPGAAVKDQAFRKDGGQFWGGILCYISLDNQRNFSVK